MDADVGKFFALSETQYAKKNFLQRQAESPYFAKVRQVVAMQRRLAPVYAARGKVIVPWDIQWP